MATLHNDWLTEGIFDFEYKKYVLLSYLQDIDQQFSSNILYPHLPELKSHFNACVLLQSTKQSIRSAFPKDIKGIDLSTWKPIYQEAERDDPYLTEINFILDFAIPKFSSALENGAGKFSEVGESISISPLGIVPLRIEEGYLFFVNSMEKMVSIFQYQVALYNEMRERYLKTMYIDSVRTGIGNTVEQIKLDLIRKHKALPIPAAYVVESKYNYPLHETLLPVAKHLMIKHLNVA